MFWDISSIIFKVKRIEKEKKKKPERFIAWTDLNTCLHEIS